jgi:hypothetical protein
MNTYQQVHQKAIYVDVNGRKKSIFDMKVKIDCFTQNLYYSSAVHGVIRHLEYNSIGMEAHMLKNNLLFTGLQEMSDENFVSVASNSLKNTMNLDINEAQKYQGLPYRKEARRSFLRRQTSYSCTICIV